MPSHPQLDALKEEMAKNEWWVKHLPAVVVNIAIDRAFNLALSLAEERVKALPKAGGGSEFAKDSKTHNGLLSDGYNLGLAEALETLASLKKEE